MADQQVQHIKLHSSQTAWIFYLIFLTMIGLFLYSLLTKLGGSGEGEDQAPYTLDLREAGASVDLKVLDGLDVVATVTKPDSKEIRFYDGYTGKLFGTIYAPVDNEEEPEIE